MKPLILIIVSLIVGILFNTTIYAQSPEKMSYQAVVRDANDHLHINQSVGMQISILQGSVDGTSVYVERHFPTSNANGLVTIVIGNGTVVEGGFTEIDWTSGPYFLKTETDLNGGANYTIAGTSQLLSVPYALHAKTAETISGGITETDPVFNAWDKTSGISITESQISDLGTYIETETDPTIIKYSVGEFAHGGIVFWVDETGQHGLVAAKEDQSTGVRWYAGTYGDTQAKGDGPFAGEANTSIIIAAQVAIGDDGDTYAARICNELQVTQDGKTYGDWYLPSKEELNLMYQNKATIDATAGANAGSSFSSVYYWSSTEGSNNIAWRQTFGIGVQSNHSKNYAYRVRAVRAF